MIYVRRTEVPAQTCGGEVCRVDAYGKETACRTECCVVDVNAVFALHELIVSIEICAYSDCRVVSESLVDIA